MNAAQFAVLTATMALASCKSTGPDTDTIVCATYAAPALSVSVEDSISGEPLYAGSKVIAREGSYADSGFLRIGQSPVIISFSLAYERKGTYEVDVARDGYKAWGKSGIVVTADQCHVRTVSLTARLVRN